MTDFPAKDQIERELQEAAHQALSTVETEIKTGLRLMLDLARETSNCETACFALNIPEHPNLARALAGFLAPATIDDLVASGSFSPKDPLVVSVSSDADEPVAITNMMDREGFAFLCVLPICLGDGRGTVFLCLTSSVQREISADQLEQLTKIATMASSQLKTAVATEKALMREEKMFQAYGDLPRERELMQQIADVSGVGGWEVDLVEDRLTWTEQIRRIYEVGPEYVPTMETAMSFFPSDAQDHLSNVIADCIEAHGSWNETLPFTTAKGRARWVQGIGKTVVEGGVVTRLIGSFRDVTEERSILQKIQRSDATQQAMFAALSEGVLLIAEDGTIQTCNPAAARLLGCEVETITGQHIKDLNSVVQFEETQSQASVNYLARAFSNPDMVKDLVIGLFRNRDKTESWIQLNASAIKHGSALDRRGVVISLTDITQAKTAALQLRERERTARRKSEELSTILANMSQGVSVFDQNGQLTVWNERYLDIFSKPRAEVYEGATLNELIEAEKTRGDFEGDVDAHVDDLFERLAMGEIVSSMFRHGTGKIISSVHAPLPFGGWIGTHEDVTIREQAAARIAHAAFHDKLTGLSNRAMFQEEMEQTHILAVNGESAYALFLIDLDRFKPVNDTYGHAIGDLLLQQVAQRLKETVRSTDVVARLGGDEFAIILKFADPAIELLEDIAGRIVKRLGNLFNIEGKSINIGGSVGVSLISHLHEDTDVSYKEADDALYAVKRTGRNDFKLHQADDGSEAARAHS